MRMFKRTLSLVLCCLLCLSWLPMGVSAAENSISVGERVTATIEYGQSTSYSFTPEESGYYYFYNRTDHYVEDPSTGYWYSTYFQCAIYDADNTYIGRSYYVSNCCGAYAYLEAGKPYTLTATNDCSLETTFAGTLYLAKPDQTSLSFTGCPDSLYLDSHNTMYCVVDGEFPVGGSVTWTVSDPAVIEFTYTSDYQVSFHALGLGAATVTATADDGRTVSKTITVKAVEPLTVGSQRSITLAYGEFARYSFTAEEAGYYYFYGTDFDYWIEPESGSSSASAQHFYVSQYSGVYRYLEAGTACILDVNNYTEGNPRTATIYLDMPDQTAPYLSGTTNRLIGDYWSMYFCVGNGVPVACDTVTWTVSDPSVMTVNYSSNSRCSLRAIAAGTATITATADDGRSASVECTVMPYTLEHSLVILRSQDTADLNVYQLDGLVWESSDTSVATVDQNGIVTSVSEGTAEITAYQNGMAYQSAAVMVQKENSSGQEISLALWAPETEALLMEDMFHTFAQNNSRWDIHLEVFSCYPGDAVRAMSAGSGNNADVYQFATDQVSTLLQMDALKPLSGTLLSQVTGDNAQSMLNSVRDTDGKFYGLPISPNTWFMYYNKDIFTEEDVTSLETMLEKGKVAFEVRNSWYVGSFFFANGGTIFGEQGIDASKGFQLGGEQGYAAAKRLIDLVNTANFIVDGDGTGNMGIKAGTIGAYFSGAWDYPALYDALGDKLGIAMVPTVEIDGETKQLKTFTGARSIGIHPDSDYPEAAQALAQFLASAECQKERFFLTNEAPVSKALLEDAEIQQNPLAMAQINTVHYASILQPSLPEMAYFWGPMGTFGFEMADGYITMDNVEQKVQQMVDDMNSQIQVVTTVASGWSGDTTWVLTSDGVLTFSGTGAMKNYTNKSQMPWYSLMDQITDVVIEEGVTRIGSYAFYGMDIETVRIPDTVTIIGEYAFKGAEKLEAVELPEKLTKIGEAAFYGCTSLKEIYIPDSIYTVVDYTFKGCTALESVRLSKQLIKVGQGAFENCTALDYIFIPTKVEIIGAWSFKGCTGLKEADMQWADATEIRPGAFKNCTALTEIILPANIEKLGDSCFYGIGAESFTVPATVTEVQDWCFARSALKEITFLGDAPAIGTGAFNKITLTAYYPGNNATWTSEILQNYGGAVTWTEK